MRTAAVLADDRARMGVSSARCHAAGPDRGGHWPDCPQECEAGRSDEYGVSEPLSDPEGRRSSACWDDERH